MSDHFPRRAYGAAVALLVLPSVVLAGCHRAEPDPRSEPPLVRTAISQPDRGASREFTGIVAARVQSDLGFRVGGKVIERLVEAGQIVRRGQPLMRIDRTDLSLASTASLGTVQPPRPGRPKRPPTRSACAIWSAPARYRPPPMIRPRPRRTQRGRNS